MGYFLKEALKTLCGVNRWSYAVFWKIGFQNPKLLVWEDCYHESSSDPRFSEFPGSSTLENICHESQDRGSLHLLVNKMMFNNQVIVVGEGLVGKAAFTGDYQWILSEDFYQQNHHHEVQNEVFQQFLGGMQTVAVIPVLPHGVIQLGSFLTIPENVDFVNDVAALILHLGCLSSGLPSENSARNGHPPRLDFSVSHGDATITGLSEKSNVFDAHCSYNSMDCFPYSQQASILDASLSTGIQNDLLLNGALFSRYQEYPKIVPEVKLKCSSSPHMNGSSEARMEQSNSCYVSGSALDISSAEDSFRKIPADLNVVFGRGLSRAAIASSDYMMNADGHSFSSHAAAPVGIKPAMQTCHSLNVARPTVNSFLSNGSSAKLDHREEALSSNGLNASKVEMLFEESFARPGCSDDLFDALGADFKNKLLSGCWNSSLENEPVANMEASEYRSSLKQAMASVDANNAHTESSENGFFSIPSTVLKVQASSMTSTDLSSSCKTTLTTMCCSFAPNPSPSYCQSASFSHGASSVCGSQLTSFLESNQKATQGSSVSTEYSKKPCVAGKATRKRLKPGDNPRPRPKDRQMIQDRVKELREIVPNGGKCSIDALLERTIKHMLFLQSVMKHADKLKQSGESRIISKNSSLVSRNNFEGGTTWAYEVGSQSMVPPIVVENLHQPRQLRVEMLCEESGLFLEIADVIRGLGLTILKGVMETRGDKIWARFVVEANRDITRMEVFISLVHLLEQGAEDGATQPHGSSSSTKNTNPEQLHTVAPDP